MTSVWLPKTSSELKTRRFRSFVRSWCDHDELSFRCPFRSGCLQFSNPCRCGYRKLSPSWKRENLVCMPTLSARETDRGNHSVAIQRRSESQSGECKGQSGVSSIALVHKKNGSYRRRGPANTKRRGVGIGDGVLQAEESRRCTRFLASPLLSTPERPWPMPNGFGSAGSRQNNLSESGATIFHSTR